MSQNTTPVTGNDVPLRCALDHLERVGTALAALVDLLRPADELAHVQREDLAMLLALLAGIDDDRAPAARAAVTDLLGSGRALGGVLRADLHALLQVLSGLHEDGRAAVSAAL